ncbi:MAB_1171c family putative transporter [Streptomyces sp. NPDC003077]|uniref:MAB_1171c family putative transporter n=1 Tax=Streptomyces sp. NPDC003077 TaxID=3154443 RepID=UPI0033AA0E42
MATWLEDGGTAALWAVALVRAPQALREKDQRPLWCALVVTALTMTMHREPVTTALARLVPGPHGPHAVDLTKHLLSVVAAAAVLWFVFQVMGWRRFVPVVCGAAVTVLAVVVLLDYAAPGHLRNRIDPSGSRSGVSDAYWWTLLAFHLIVDTVCGVICWSHCGYGVPRLLRYGLRLFGTGILLASVLWALKICYMVTGEEALVPLFSPISGAEGLFLAVGCALPVVARLATRRRYRRAYRGLTPLWRELTAAAPDVVLGGAHPLQAAVLPLQLRLYRRVIEIRDAMLVLRNYVPPGTLERIRRHIGGLGVPAHLADAHITACWLAAALHARDLGREPEPQTDDLSGPGAPDLAEEIEHLLRLATAYRSPAVRAFRGSPTGGDHVAEPSREPSGPGRSAASRSAVSRSAALGWLRR